MMITQSYYRLGIVSIKMKTNPTIGKLREILEMTFRAGIAFERRDMETGKHLFMKVPEAEKQVIAWALEAVGEDFVFDRPRHDYLPNVYLYAKAKNELRAEIRAKLTGGTE